MQAITKPLVSFSVNISLYVALFKIIQEIFFKITLRTFWNESGKNSLCFLAVESGEEGRETIPDGQARKKKQRRNKTS
jgi:hypothetical protein